MKYLVIAAAGSLALMSGAVYAGGGCSYGNHAAELETQEPVLAAAEEQDPKLLAKLKSTEEADSLEHLIETPVIHN